MIYVMILISVRIFLRENEVAQMGYKDITPDITTVKEGGRVVGIAFSIQGKSDANPVTLMMWNDDVFPEFCPVRHLLAWIGMTGISTGF
jgi:plasmid replication initiation protein